MKPVTYGPDTTMEWLEFADVNDEEHFFRINLTYFLSNYNCIYGAGCNGIKSDMPRPETGCCAQGVGFVNEEDVANVAAQVELLTEKHSHPDNLKHIREKGWSVSNKYGEPYKTRKKNNMCIFANPQPTDPSHPPMGCAFHHLATDLGVSHVETKPEVCWQVPMYISEELNSAYKDVTIITTQSLDEWGGEPYNPNDPNDDPLRNDYLAFWCVDSPDAYNGSEAYYKNAKDELTKIMGADNYARLCELMDEYGERKFKMAGEKVNGGKPIIASLTSMFENLRELREKKNASS